MKKELEKKLRILTKPDNDAMMQGCTQYALESFIDEHFVEKEETFVSKTKSVLLDALDGKESTDEDVEEIYRLARREVKRCTCRCASCHHCMGERVKPYTKEQVLELIGEDKDENYLHFNDQGAMELPEYKKNEVKGYNQAKQEIRDRLCD